MRYFIYLQYDGTAYHGWQTQPNAVSVQETIEQKLSMLLNRAVFIIGAGRTDAGVHARLMVAHFELSDTQKNTLQKKDAAESHQNTGTDHPIADKNQDSGIQQDKNKNSLQTDLSRLTKRLNQVLPNDIAILKIVPVKNEAHARFSPISRTYRYYITTDKSPFNRRYAYHVHWQLDIEKMNEAARHLFDFTDFTSFSKLHTDVKTNNCRITTAHWKETAPGHLVFTIKADRFLRNMVRAIVGTLILVGRGRLSIEQFCHTIEQKNRCSAGDSAPAQALFLEDIEYPEDIFFPEK